MARKIVTRADQILGTDAIGEPPKIACLGSKVAYAVKTDQAHETSRPWEPCWRCGKSMGCSLCVLQSDLICRACLAWTSREQFLLHGNISNDVDSIKARGGRKAVDWRNYPSDWVSEYSRHASGASDDAFYQDYRKRLKEWVAQALIRTPTKKQLENRRNRQVEELKRLKVK